MTDHARLPIDASLTQAALRLVAAALATLALLPPLLWGAIVMLVQRQTAGSGAAEWQAFTPLSIAGVALASTGLALALWVFFCHRPMHALRRGERQLRVFAMRDALTGLPNRDALRQALERALARCHATPRGLGVLVIDLDRFRLVNDSLGPSVGDALLRSAAQRIRAAVRDTDIVARLSTDRFVVQVEGVSGVQALTVMARNLLRAFQAPHSVGGHETVSSLSIGIALAGEDADSVDALLKCAEVAMRAAKAAGGGRFCCFEAALHVDDQKRLDLDLRLRRALRDNEFTLAFQPIMDARGERIDGVEALIRWADPQHGMVSPAEFIPVLEQNGLIVDVGTWVLRESCRQALRWMRGAAPTLVLSVNVSPRQFGEAGFVDSVTAVLAQTGFAANRLQLEVTEGLLLDPSPETLSKIGALVGSGVRLAIDDFGMGYSSLAYLKTFPLHTLKIDRLFVNDIAATQRDAAIVRAIIELGHGLGLKVTAEGVETAQQFETLRQLGCDALQGYLFSRPLPAAQFQALLESTAAGALPGRPHKQAEPLTA